MSAHQVYGQSRSINGTVTSDDQAPLAGVTVKIQGTDIAVMSNDLGKFTVQATKGQVLALSFIGYENRTFTIGDANDISIVLPKTTTSLEDVVVVGYGTQKKSDLTNAIATVDVQKTFANRPLSDPIRALQGVVPGLNINYSNGGLTTAASIRIRGIGSLNGTNNPLIMVDNIETPDLSIINPNDIESISVLKDATSASIYGARAAFGVVLIKLKQGKRNISPVVSYNSNYAWSKAQGLPKFADPVKELDGLILGSKRAGTTSPELFGMQLDKLRDGIANWQKNYASTNTGMEMIKGQDFDIINGQPYFYKVWDVDKVMFRTMPQINQALSIMGGSEKVSYYLSGSYNNQGGMLKINPDNIKKYNITGGLNVDVTKWWTVGLKMLYRNFEYTYPYQYQDYFYYMWRWGSYWPYGTYQGNYFRNVPGLMANAQQAYTKDNYTRVDLTSRLKLTKHLDLDLNYTIGKDNVLNHEVGGPVMLWNFWSANMPLQDVTTAAQNVAAYTANRYRQNTFNAFLTYENRWNKHHFKATTGINAEEYENLGFTGSRRNLLDPSKGELPLATGDQFATGNHGNRAYAGYFGRLNYDYQGKYLLELMGRYDGSSSFPVNDRWAFFSGASAGYMITKEDFMDFAKPVLNEWKIRASLGSIGNQDVGGQFFIPTMYPTQASWMYNGNYVQGVTPPLSVPNSLTWEKVQTFDIGTDLSFLKDNMLTLTFDWFQRTTSNMITTVTLPGTFGTSAQLNPRRNDGELRSRGYEVTINGNFPLTKDLALYTMLGFADSRAVVTKWYNPSQLIGNYYSGAIYGDIWGFETDRYFTSSDFTTDPNGKLIYANGIPSQASLIGSTNNFTFGPGDIKYKDLNGDGIINGGKASATDHGDLKVIGNSQPRYNFTFRIGAAYKSFDIDVFAQGVGKRNLWGIGNVIIPMYQGADILYANQTDFWTENTPDARFPNPYVGNGAVGTIAGLSGGSNNFYPQTKYLLNLSYGRLKNLTLGYTLPQFFLSKYHIQKCRFYLSGENLITIKDKNLPIDPEAFDAASTTGGGFTGRTWPVARTFSFGLQINFQ
ncbi:SusC/RagA family TonB-linked outer membrane protein [Niabella sp. 22666]|uniref:SusC/RagA family TonB-linked outer membrane protein n=1 Tax=Niabella sp. 22666 TaxID=3453954 RepID=UPI003F865AA9